MYKNALKEDFIRVVEDLDGTVESTDTIAKLKTKIENSSTFESDPDFVKTLIQNCIDERVSRNEREITLEKQKIELATLQLAKLEKEIELQTAKNKALSLIPAAKVEEKQFETNIEKMITSIKTLSLPVPTRSENFNLFFQSLERAFLTKKINDEYKSEILINLLGERAHNVLLYIKEEELNDYEKLKSIVLREFQLTPRECLNSFKNAVKSSGETYIQFAARLTANFQYIIETATHIGIREAEDWFRPIDLAKECDIYISSRGGSRKETPITYGYTQDPFKNRPRNFKPKVKENYPQYLERQKKNCFICGDSSHYARDCAHAYAYPNVVSVSNVIENSSYDLTHVKNFNTRNDSSSLVKNYKFNNIKSTKLKMCIKLKNDIPVCQRARRLSCSEKLQVNNQIDDWLRQGIIKESVFDYCSPIVLCKKANGAMKTSSVEFISRSPNPLPMKSEHRRFVLLRRIFQPWQWKRRKKRNRFEQTSRTLQRKISMRSTKDQLVKKDVLMPVKNNVFLWNLPDVEEVPSHDGETV
ncbi:DUF1758 domain-containing protein [Trichonephila clavipes]|nr:DUF1758 domain-containing protein [Trichonephila clavipes]